jgi:hypothetical protein
MISFNWLFFLGMPVSSNSMSGIPGQHPSSYYPGQPAPGQGVCIFYF